MSTELTKNIEHASLHRLMGPSDTISRLVDEVHRVAQSDFTVIIYGETGSGKELIAQAIHHASPRSGGPFVAIDCGAIQETLLESELFGHERGAFTGAVQKKNGKFEDAKNGILLLDEISNMTLGSQAKLLRALQEKRIYRVGGTTSFEVDVRILVSCNQDLSKTDESCAFRRDLYYRLNDFTIRILPLRERKEDIPHLVHRFLETTNMELGKKVVGISDEAMTALKIYDWPGNVRQLRAIIRRAVLLADTHIEIKDLELASDEVSVKMFPGLADKPWEKYALKEIVKQQVDVVE